MTEVFINGQLIDSIDTDIALTLSSFKIDSLGTRKGSFSNVFDLPKTNANKLLFENSELVTSVTSIPYQLNPCQIFVDGQLIVDGSAVIRETKENYRIFISAGNSDFFKLIGSLKIKDINLSEFDHLFNIFDVPPLRESREGFVYPNIDYGYFEFADINEPIQPVEFFAPSMYIKSIVLKGLQQIGYTLSGDLLDSVTFQNGVVLCKYPGINLMDSTAKYRQNFVFGDLTENQSQLIGFSEKISDKSNLYNFDNNIGQFVYQPPIEDKDNVIFNISFVGTVITNAPFTFQNTDFFIDLLVYNDQGQLLTTVSRSVKFENRNIGFLGSYRRPANGVLIRELNFPFFIQPQDTNFINLINNTADLTTLRLGWGVRTQVTSLDLDKIKLENIEFQIDQSPRITGTRLQQLFSIPVESEVLLPQNETVSDLLLTIANIEGIIFQVDESSKTVRTSMLDRLINQKANALDWSDKLDLTDEPEVIYTLDNFAQSNIYKFAEDDKDPFLPKLFNQGSINVFNQNIKTQNVVFESKFASVPVSASFRGDLLIGKVFTGDKYSFDGVNFNFNEDSKTEDFKPRIAVLAESQATIQLTTLNPNTINFEVSTLSMDFERAINNNYNLIKSVLVNTKVIKALFLLDLEDITNLDFTRPVFVDYFGEYFYIESINQFKVNKRESCFVTLVRI